MDRYEYGVDGAQRHLSMNVARLGAKRDGRAAHRIYISRLATLTPCSALQSYPALIVELFCTQSSSGKFS